MTQTEISPQDIYLEAVRAAGIAEDVSAWRSKVDAIAVQISDGMGTFVKAQGSVARSITLVGTVVDVEENPRAEGSGKQLDLFKVKFQADSGTRLDSMWIDKRTPAGVELFAQAKALVGKRARIVKESRVQYNGAEPAIEAGSVVTRPYLASIQPEDAPAKASATVAAAEQTTPVEQTASAEPAAGVPTTTKSSPKSKRDELLKLSPTSPKQVVDLAKEHFSMTDQAIKDAVETTIGPKDPARARTKADLKRAWSAIVYAQLPDAA